MSKKVMIDPGHAPGNVNGGKNGYLEHSGMWKLSNYLKTVLEYCGLDVALTRAQNEDPTLTARGRKAAGYDLFISEHSNAANGAARGVEVFYSVNIPADKALAAAMSRDVAAFMKNADRGAKTRESTNTKGADYYTVMLEAQRAGAAHVLLIENGFHDNAADEDILLKDDNLKAMAEIQAKVICQYLDVTYAVAHSPAPKPATPQTESVTVKANGTVKFDLPGRGIIDIPGMIIDGVTHVEARYLLESMGYIVDWNAASSAVIVRQKSLVHHITSEEQTILEKIVEAEAGGEDWMGKILVVNVIWNRINDKGFPNSVKDVVFQQNQFEPTRNGAYDKAVPSTDTKLAVQEALRVDHSRGALYFRSIKGVTPECWHETALMFLFEHRGHRFYK